MARFSIIDNFIKGQVIVQFFFKTKLRKLLESKKTRENSIASPFFDANYYIENYPEAIKDTRLSPLEFFLNYGYKQGHNPSKYFDTEFYLSTYPDVKSSDINPLVHYIECGWKEGRNPSTQFDTDFYLTTNPDVKDAGVNPLMHYILFGEIEEREIKRGIKELSTNLFKSLIASAFIDETVEQKESIDIIDTITVDISSYTSIVISVSHDDPFKNIGGVQNIIRTEYDTLKTMNVCYINIFPVLFQPYLLSEEKKPHDFIFNLMINGEIIGASNVEVLIEWLDKVECQKIDLFVHHLMNISPEAISHLATKYSIVPKVWIHDFFTICPQYNLLRNNVDYCRAPDIKSMECNICAYSALRAEHVQRIKEFFRITRPIIISPSKFAYLAWKEMNNYSYSDECYIAPPVTLQASDNYRTLYKPNTPIRIAFVGQNTYHKGWLSYCNLVSKLMNHDNYVFYHLGVFNIHYQLDNSEIVKSIQNIDVRSSQEMLEALDINNIDVVIIWSKWPETFCIAAHEVIASGATLITHKDAGNIPHAFEHLIDKQVFVLENDENILEEFLLSSNFMETLVNTSNPTSVIKENTDYLINFIK